MIAIVAACTSASTHPFGAADDPPTTNADGASFFGGDASDSERRPSCECDAGSLEIRVAGDGADQVLAYPNPRALCSSPGPSGYFYSCGAAPLFTQEIAACGAPDGGGTCLLFDVPDQSSGYVDRDGESWDLIDASLAFDGGVLRIDDSTASGAFAARATRPCDAGSCGIELSGTFRTCALRVEINGCE